MYYGLTVSAARHTVGQSKRGITLDTNSGLKSTVVIFFSTICKEVENILTQMLAKIYADLHSI